LVLCIPKSAVPYSTRFFLPGALINYKFKKPGVFYRAMADLITLFNTVQINLKRLEKSNQHEITFLAERCEALFESFQAFQLKPALVAGKEKALVSAEQLLIKILAFIKEPRFQKQTWHAQLLKCLSAYQDVTDLKDFSDKLYELATDLDVVLQLNTTIQLEDVKDSRAKCTIEALELLGKADLLTTAPSDTEAIKAELDKAIETLNILTSVMANTVTKPAPSSSSPRGGSSAKVVPVATNHDMDMPTQAQLSEERLKLINWKRLEFNEEKSRLLGQGSFGKVYECVYKNNSAAVKCLPAIRGSGNDPKLLKSLRQAILIMQSVSHPNIIAFFGADLERLVLIVEMGCGSLIDVLYDANWGGSTASDNSLFMPTFTFRSFEWKCSVVNDIASGLRYLHTNQIIHRDIKPTNIIIVPVGRRLVAKLCDIGISSAMEKLVASTQSHKSQNCLRSVSYMAPELFADTEPQQYNICTDMYAFGVLVAELFVEKRPWNGVAEADIVHGVAKMNKRPLVDDWQPHEGVEKQLLDLVGSASAGCFAVASAQRPTSGSFVKLLSPKKEYNHVDIFSSSRSTTATRQKHPASQVEITDRTQKMIDAIMEWFQTCCPDVDRDILLTYASSMCAKNVTTIARLRRLAAQIEDRPNYLKTEFSFSDLDSVDIAAALEANPADIEIWPSSQRSQGVQVVRSWLEANCPDVCSRNVSSIAAQLVSNDIVTTERFCRLLADAKFDFSFLSVDFLDWNDIRAAASPLKLTTRPPMNSLWKVGLSEWLAACLVDTDKTVVEDIIEDLQHANIHTVNRLAQMVKSSSVPCFTSLKEMTDIKRRLFADWDPMDLVDIRTCLDLTVPPIPREHGQKALWSWLCRAVPDIPTAKCTQYAASIEVAGVKTVNRLKNVLQSNPLFLAGIGVDPLDAADIVSAIQEYHVSRTSQGLVAIRTSDGPSQGERCLVSWLTANVPSLFERSVVQYSLQLIERNVVTVNRMVNLILSDANWLLTVLGPGSELDVLDISEAVVACTQIKIDDMVFLDKRKGRVFGVNYADSTRRVEFLDGTMDDGAPMAFLTVIRGQKSNLVELDNDTIRIAVTKWFTERKAAVLEYGNISAWNTSLVTDMGSLFMNRNDFNEPIGEWDVSNVTNMVAMFHDAADFNQPLNTWNVGNVTNMAKMFFQAKRFNQRLSRWNTGKVVDMESMFEGACALTELPTKWNSLDSAVLTNMFCRCRFTNDSLRDAVGLWCGQKEKAFAAYGHISNWDTSLVTNMSSLFQDQIHFNESIGTWDVSNVQDMSRMFLNAASFNQPLRTWNTEKVTNVEFMFDGAKAFDQQLNSLCFQKHINVQQMLRNTFTDSSTAKEFDYSVKLFEEAVDLPMLAVNAFTDQSLREAVWLWFDNRPAAAAKYGDISAWNTSQVTSMRELFRGREDFNDPIGGWDVSNVTDMQWMFWGAKSFNQPLSTWNVAKVTTMCGMFDTASTFNESLHAWNVGRVLSMDGMFDGAVVFNQPLSSWDVSSVISMCNMFCGARAFNYPLHMWNVSRVTNMSNMFYSARSFNQPLNPWNVSSVTDMSKMFHDASAFNQPLDSWCVAYVTAMYSMFESATSFNQPLQSWNVSCVTDMGNMFRGAVSFNQPLGRWNVDSTVCMNCMFEGTALGTSLPSWMTDRKVGKRTL
jgi:surface protein